jgi:hypothetical protein
MKKWQIRKAWKLQFWKQTGEKKGGREAHEGKQVPWDYIPLGRAKNEER